MTVKCGIHNPDALTYPPTTAPPPTTTTIPTTTVFIWQSKSTPGGSGENTPPTPDQGGQTLTTQAGTPVVKSGPGTGKNYNTAYLETTWYNTRKLDGFKCLRKAEKA